MYTASNTLARDFVPCYRKSDNKPGLYDLVNDVFYTNQGIGEFAFPSEPIRYTSKLILNGEEYQFAAPSGGGGLPAEYQEVEYIESSGIQYFNVGTTFNTNYKVVIDFQMLNSTSDQIPVGVKETSGGYTYKYGINVYNNLYYISAGSDSWATFSADTNRHTITINKTSVTIDSTSGIISHQSFTYSLGLGVFRYNGNDPIYSSNKLYSLQIYDENGILKNDLVPCYRKLDTETGMYDLVNNVFYTNDGTGSFIKGPDVN